MRRWRLLLIVLPAVAGGALWWFRAPLAAWFHSADGGVEMTVRKSPQPDPETYAVLVSELQRWRNDLAARHQRARNDEERAAVERDARIILEQTLPAMMRCWLGTPYDFNGTAAKPGGGRIACGYYVATVLMDAGFRVDRYQLAKQPAENILRSFLEKDACTLSVGKPYDAFAADLGKADPGIYLVGLDTHVAFAIPGAEGGFRFIHASGSNPWCVVDEGRDEALVLQRSNWRMLGNLTADGGVIRRWLGGEKILVRGG
jgi:hypothetical protein